MSNETDVKTENPNVHNGENSSLQDPSLGTFSTSVSNADQSMIDVARILKKEPGLAYIFAKVGSELMDISKRSVENTSQIESINKSVDVLVGHVGKLVSNGMFNGILNDTIGANFMKVLGRTNTLTGLFHVTCLDSNGEMYVVISLKLVAT